MDHSGHLAGGHNWWIPASREMGGLSPTSTATGGGRSLAGNEQGIQFRSPLDARRAAKGPIPQAEYPDGYLGNIIDRRQDKLVKAVQDRNQRSYQRGVHKGSLISPGDYFWPEDTLSPEDGLNRRTKVWDQDRLLTLVQKRQAPKGEPVQVLVNDGKSPPQVNGETYNQQASVLQDPLEVIHFERMTPQYRTAHK